MNEPLGTGICNKMVIDKVIVNKYISIHRWLLPGGIACIDTEGPGPVNINSLSWPGNTSYSSNRYLVT